MALVEKIGVHQVYIPDKYLELLKVVGFSKKVITKDVKEL